MRPLAMLAALALAASADEPQLPSTEDALAADLVDAKFNPVTAPGFPPGVSAAPIAVDPATKASIGYAKLAAGTRLPRHWHSHAEYTVLISGAGVIDVAGRPHEVAPGTYVVIPAKAEHEFRCGAGADCVLLTRRAGPTDYNWVKK